MQIRSRIPILVLLIFITNLSCKKLVSVPSPVISVNSANVYSSDPTAIAVLTGIYTNMSSADASINGIASLYLYASLSADELTLFDVSNILYNPYYTNALTNSNTSVDYWKILYPIIYQANAAIEGLSNGVGLTPAIKQQLLGEAYFVRAFCYFYLTNLYGDCALATSTDYSANAVLPRSSSAAIWQQVVADLHTAQGLLSSNFLDATLLKTTSERTRPTVWAATALLARAYLYTSNWRGADSAASSIIGNSGYSLAPLTGTSRVFVKNSIESIWQLQAVGTVGGNVNTGEGYLFVLPTTGPNTSGTYPVYLGNALLKSFEVGDQRRVNWVDSVKVGTTLYYFPYKYQAGRLNTTTTEYSTVLRLAELYLIRAEARAEEGIVTGANSAAADLNAIRQRAGLSGTSATIQSDMLAAILHERQVELFTEWGHRWMDIKRTMTVDAIMGAPGNACSNKGGSWSTTWEWYPIALSELKADSHLQQNAGY